MPSKNLVVFGGTGWVGQNIVKKAVAAGWDVTAVSRSGQAPYQFPDAWKVQWMSCDATNREAVQELLAFKVPGPIDAVISCIGLLTLNRTQAIVMNGQTNVNIVSCIYNRQQMILHDRALDLAAAGGGSSAAPSKSSTAPAPAAPAANTASPEKKELATKNTSGSSALTGVPSPAKSELNLRDDSKYNDPDRRAPNTALLHRQESELSTSPFAIRVGERTQLPALTNHPSGLPRVVFISAASFGFPFTKILRGYYDGKIQAEKAMQLHVGGRGAIIRPGAIHGMRRTSGGIPIPLSAIFLPLELGFPFWHRVTGLRCLQPPSHVTAVAAAALAAADGDPHDESLAMRHQMVAGYGHARRGVPGYSEVKLDTPIFEYDSIQALSHEWKKNH